VVIKQDRSGRPELGLAELLHHEYEILRALEAPGVPRPLEFATIEGHPSLVLEDVGSRNLAESLGARPLATEAFLELAPKMVEIVREVHAHSVIHRDICPKNFVLDGPGGNVALVDFESATVVPAFTEVPGTPGLLVGTPAYMAPEQTGRMKRLVDRRADLYSLGATFYELLTGQPPFPSRDFLELLHAHAARAPYPPAIVNKDVPMMVSDIVVKLLAKTPEWRYQTAEALAADLKEAREQWRRHGQVAHFELGRQDMPYGLLLEAERLYGRDGETRLLAEAFDRVQAGASEVLFVTGQAGIGKSALVNTLREAALAKGRWIAGKGDLLRDNVPYAPIVDAFRGLVVALQSEPEEVLARVRERVREGTNPNGSVLTEAIPDLKPLLGDQPPVPSIGSVEDQNRFQLVFTAFVRALLAEGPPLVLFLDDLQWVDASSLKLLRAVAVDPEIRSLLLLCACRSEGLGPGHPVTAALESIRMAGARVATVELGPLDPDSVLALLCDALRVEPARAASLADVVRRKTASNPFFVRQFLGYLYRKALLVFDVEQGRWTWDAERIEAAEITANVVDLLSKVIATLPGEAQEALQAAACIGNRFELGMLAGLLEAPLDAAARALWAPVAEGLVIPAVEGPRFPWAAGKLVELGTAVAPAFRFAHDRLQQAAYELLSEERRKALHLRIGRWLEKNVPEEAFESALGAIADQLDRAADQLPDAERIRLAGLNERAGRQARAAAAHGPALGYFQAGIRLLPPEPWRGELHALWFTLLRGAAECAGLTGDHELSERLVDEGLARAGTLLEKADLCTIGVQTNALRGTHEKAIQRAREGLMALGSELPDQPSASVVEAEGERARAVLSARPDWRMLESRPMEDPVDRAKLELLIKLSSSWFVAPELFQIVACRAAALTAERGLAPGSAVAFAYYAIALAMRGRYEEAYHHGRVGVQLAERQSNPVEESRALLCLGGHVGPWRAPLAECVSMLQRSYARGVGSGDFEFAAYALANLVFARMFSGARLDQVLAEAESALTFYRRIQHSSGVPYVQPFIQAVRCLKGLTRGPTTFDDDLFEEARFRAEWAENGLGQAVFLTLRLQACYLLGDPESAWEYATQAAPWLPYWRSLFFQADFHFYAALTAARLSRRDRRGGQRATAAQVREHLLALEAWAASAPMSFKHKRDLVAAELARIEDRPVDALALYQAAIEEAGRGGFAQDEALAHELCARFHRTLDASRMADLHFSIALEGYSLWGAFGKVERLGREIPSLRLSGRLRHVTTSSAPPGLDYYNLVRSSETLAGELVFEKLLVKLVRTSGEVAGAERTVLVLDQGGLVQRVRASSTGEVVLEERPLASSRSVPASIVEQVFSSREFLVLGDARAGRYAQDPYVSEHGVRSVLAVPIVRAGRALGVLYFENNLTSDAFTPERVEMFRLLSAQMAIAIENSRLFEERKRSEAGLRLLSDASARLSETLDYREVLSKISQIAVPALADWCVVDAMEDGVLRPVSWAHVDPTRVSAVEELHRRYPLDASSTQPQGQVLRSKRPLLIPEITEDIILTGTRDEGNLRLIRALGPRSLMVVPMVARGRSIGVVTFASVHPTRRFRPSDLSLAEELVRRVGLALDNARIHHDLREALRQREERDHHLRIVFRHLPGVIWAADRDLKITYVTGSLFNVEGERPARPIGSSVYDLLETRDPANVVIARHLAALHGQGQSFEHQFRGRWYAVLIDPIFDEAGGIVGCVGAAFDITSRREIAERLARSERRLREAQRVANVGSFEWDIQLNVLTWSDELQRIYGFEPGQFGGTFEAFMARVPADEVEATRKVIFDAYASLSPFTYDHRIIRTDGSIRVLHSRGDVIKDEQGKPIRMIGTCWDVTEQKELIRKLEQAVSRWEATVNATAEGILVVDLDGKVITVNRRHLALWQLPTRAPEGLHHVHLLAPALDQLEDPQAFLQRIDEIYAHRDQESFDVIRFKDGRIFERYSTPQRIGDEITGRVWSVRDVTERERLLRRALFLADATRLLASLDVEQALDGVAHLAVPHLGDGCAIDLFGDGGPRRLIAVSRDPRRPISPEIHPTVLGGTSIIYRIATISYLGVPLLMKGRLVGAITLSAAPHSKYTSSDLEVAEELARRAALAIDNARLYRRAQEALRARDEFLSIAAHEIRGPINSIHLAVQSVRQAKVPPEALPKLFEIVERQDRRLSQFADEILDFGRIRAGQLQLEYEDVNLGEVVRDVAARLGPEIARSGSSLTVTVPGQVVGQWDRSRLDQVVSNLLSNAIKFGFGKPIEIVIGAREGRAFLIVRDHGMGIEPEDRKRIFQPFERGVSVRHYGGLGLGLHIVKTIVNALGGSVNVTSEPGGGSTFRVELPQARVGAERDAHLDS
jgi:PAS domain S-box-containing protein